ncbi:glycogen synthase [Deminuibacter soli]|uniref:Glycogen synthase n=1 Tax=Deminuibacter soli TaxID=2291815 RepID=A0A3E1NJR2_9BACT|nr:glycogen synthase [Deminuibacter soli]RFM28162.1 glycogen synthase [Deminuibacter soli]
MEILHVSAECYPVAKAGGLGDVVGALPKYQNKMGHQSKVVMPMYRTKFLYQNQFDVDFKGRTHIGDYWFDFTIIREKTRKLGFDLYLVDINGLLDRERIYGYHDDTERFMAFQVAVINWINHWEHKPDVIHCHDHHTAMIPFMIQHCYEYNRLANVPTVLTIHNAQYQGWMGWDKSNYIPAWDPWKGGLLEWKNTINPLACGIRCAWKVTTVSWSYLDELKYMSNGLEALFEYEKGKCVGILNGIDAEVWDPATDPMISTGYNPDTVEEGKAASKKSLCAEFELDEQNPLIVFIGRLVGEKAADILPDAILSALYSMQGKVNFLILGSGEPHIEWQLNQLKGHFPGNYNVFIGYDEALSHRIYAGADFLLMPSRVEPCGLNQMYAMKYGTVPMVRNTGGLRDTVTDMGDWQGWGIRFNHASVGDVTYSVNRAVEAFADKEHLHWMRQHMMSIDHSWENSVQQYINVYQSIKP